MASIDQLPNEILIQIFSNFLATEKQWNLFNILRKVCRKWEKIALDTYLWKTFDGTLDLKEFQFLCYKKALKNTTDIKFKKSENAINSTKLQKMYKNLPCVRRINFSASAFTECFLTNLGDKCPELCEIIFCGGDERTKLKLVSKKFEKFFTLHGSKLTYLDFSNICIINPDKLFLLVAETCPNLEEFLMQNLGFHANIKFPVELMQNNCQKLKVLRLGFPIRFNMKVKKSWRGFPELEVFTHCGMGDLELRDETFQKLLFLSTKLKVLDIRGCSLLTADAICSLPATDLKRLFVSRSKINYTKSVQKLLEKWSHSLVEIDMSKTDLEQINLILYSVVLHSGMRKLESLSVSFTKLNIPVLKFLIHNCPNLRYLQLDGCRRIGRRMMHTYYTREQLLELLLKLEENADLEHDMDWNK